MLRTVSPRFPIIKPTASRGTWTESFVGPVGGGGGGGGVGDVLFEEVVGAV